MAARFNAKAERNGSPTRIVYAAELVFPDFKVKLPFFPNATHRQRWLPEMVRDWTNAAWIVLDGRMHVKSGANDGSYIGQRAQTLVYENAAYKGVPSPDSWTSGVCLTDDGEVRHDVFTVTKEEDEQLRAQSGGDAPIATAGEPRWKPERAVRSEADREEAQDRKSVFDELVLVASPDSWSYQHFHDRVVNIMLQARKQLTAGATTAIAGRKHLFSLGSELWRMLLQLPADTSDQELEAHMLRGRGPTYAKRLIHTCRGVLIHPWYFLGFRHLLGLTFPPMAERRTVLYLSRGTPAANFQAKPGYPAGRRVINEDALISAMEALLKERGKDEQLVVFRSEDYPDLAAMKTLMAGVSAIVGPHGGAFPCLNYAPPQTLVLEFLVRRIVGYYEVAVTLDMRYWAFMYERASSKDDMNVDVDEVIHVMRMELGQQKEYVSLQPHSAFPGALMR